MDEENKEIEVVEAEPVEETDTAQEIEKIDKEIAAVMKKYKLSMYAIIACIVVYLICLFAVKQPVITLIVCIPMIIFAVINSKQAKKIRALAQDKANLTKQQEAEENGTVLPEGGAIVANVESLNELPKQYTVLDAVELDGRTIPNVIISPYGISIVGDEEDEAAVKKVLADNSLEAPIFLYEPTEDIAALATQIQSEQTPALSEPEIMTILYKVTGLK